MYDSSYFSGDGNEGVGFPSIILMLFSGSYLMCLCVRACLGNLLWQYVNCMNWTVVGGW